MSFFPTLVSFKKPELQSHVSKANSECFPWFKMFPWVRLKLGKQGDVKTEWVARLQSLDEKGQIFLFSAVSGPRTRPSFPWHQFTCVQTISCGVHADLEKYRCCCCLVTQLCQTLCEPMDCSPPGSSVHGILQARILESVAVPSFGGIFTTQRLNLRLLH